MMYYDQHKQLHKNDRAYASERGYGAKWQRERKKFLGNEVDFIVTHCCSSSSQALYSGGRFTPDMLTDYLEKIRQTCSFKKWFFGHYHDNRNINAEEILLYEQIIRIS